MKRGTPRAKALRRAMSLPEVLLWQRLKGRKPAFRRQIPHGPYVVDLYCAPARLAIEIDGGTHEFSGDADAARDAGLARMAILTRRIAARDVLADPATVADFCLALARERIASFGDREEEP